MSNFTNIAMRTIEREQMICQNDIIVIGVSGGADSMSLLNFLMSIRDKYNLALKVCHVNHGIRDITAKRDEDFVREFCERNNIECYVKCENIPLLASQWQMSEEEAGRKVRYEFFNQIAGANGKIATAHNQNDNVETVLMRIMRGTGLAGLCGIKYKRDNIIRPILDVSRDTIEEYLAEHNISYVTDETNLETDYTRNKIRLDMIPYIKKTFNPNFNNTLSDNIVTYQEDEDFITAEVEKCYNAFWDKYKHYTNLSIVKNFHPAIMKRFFIRALREVSGNPSMSTPPAALEELVNSIKNDKYCKISFPCNMIIEITRDKICVYNSNNKVERPEISIDSNSGEINLSSGECISVDLVDSDFITSTGSVCYIPVDKKLNLKFRVARDGDRFITNENMSQKLKKIYQSHYEHNDKNRYVLADDNGNVYWIPKVQSARWNCRSGKFLRLSLK